MQELDLLVGLIGQNLSSQQKRCFTVESCTGGLVCATLSSVSGSSHWLEGGVVTYSNALKQQLVGVPLQLILSSGAVSRNVVTAMACGALERYPVDIAVAISGVAGPTGGTTKNPVGTVWFAWAMLDNTQVLCQHFHGDRTAIREQAVVCALTGILRCLQGEVL